MKLSNKTTCLITLIFTVCFVGAAYAGIENPFEDSASKGQEFIDLFLKHIVSVAATIAFIFAGVGFAFNKVKWDTFGRIAVACVICAGANEFVLWILS